MQIKALLPEQVTLRGAAFAETEPDRWNWKQRVWVRVYKSNRTRPIPLLRERSSVERLTVNRMYHVDRLAALRLVTSTLATTFRATCC